MTQTTYDKANSILEIRGIEEKREAILTHLHLLSEIEKLSADDPLGKALDDLFREKEEDSKEPHFFLRDHVVEEMARLEPADYWRYLRYRYAYELYPIIHHVDKFPQWFKLSPHQFVIIAVCSATRPIPGYLTRRTATWVP